MDSSDQAATFLNSAEELHRLREMFAQSPSFLCLLSGPEHRFVLVNPAYQQLIGDRNVVGLTVRQAIPEAESQGFAGLLDRVFASGIPYTGKDARIVLQRRPDGDAETRILDFVYDMAVESRLARGAELERLF